MSLIRRVNARAYPSVAAGTVSAPEGPTAWTRARADRFAGWAAEARAFVAGVPTEFVARDEDLTPRPRRLKADWKSKTVLAPFHPQEVVRCLRVPAPPDPPGLWDADRPAPATRANPDGAGWGKRLLIVDDREPYRTRSLAWYRDHKGFACDVVGTAAEALVLLLQGSPDQYDWIVSDISMEYELAGIYLARLWSRLPLTAVRVLSSTGFDNWFGKLGGFVFLPGHVDWVIPKESLKRHGRPRYLRCRGGMG